jgi:hypothetical protein
MKELPKIVMLDQEDKTLFAKFEEKQRNVQATFQQFAIAGERRMQELQDEGKSLWDAMGKKHGIDPEAVQYTLEGDKLVPKAMKL